MPKSVKTKPRKSSKKSEKSVSKKPKTVRGKKVVVKPKKKKSSVSAKSTKAKAKSKKPDVKGKAVKVSKKAEVSKANKEVASGKKVKKAKKPIAKKTVKKTAIKKDSKKKTPVTKKSAVKGPAGVRPYQPKKDEEYMNDAQMKHFRNMLSSWKSQLLNEFSNTKQHMQQETANRPDPVDRASQEIDFNLELRARDRERKLLKKIEEALRRIEEQSYGYCDDCGNEIGIKRLEARPTATLCIDCKTISELREKQMGEIEEG